MALIKIFLEMENKKEITNCPKAFILISIITILFTSGVVAAIVTGLFSHDIARINNDNNKTIQMISTNQQYIGLAVNILREKPPYSDCDTVLRSWAIKLLNVCAPDRAKLDSKAREVLLECPIFQTYRQETYRCPDGSLPNWDGNCP